MTTVAIPLSLFVALVVTNVLLAIFSLIANKLLHEFLDALKHDKISSANPHFIGPLEYLEQVSTLLVIIFVVSIGLFVGLIIEYFFFL